MNGDSRVQQLVDQVLNSQATPEEACASCPELLPEVRRRLQKIDRLQGELDALFPASTAHGNGPPPLPPPACGLPQIPGYELQGVLGQGGVGIVYRAFHQRLQRPVAVKMLLAGAHAQQADRSRFQREAEAVAALRHPNIVQIYDVNEADDQLYFTMELVEGGSLAEAIRGVPKPAREAAALMARLADAIHAAHQNGIVHRDLKPGNILLTADGTPKVTDFGLARRLDCREGLTFSGALVGTPSYMAPEQARGEKTAIGPATDIYALGSILYELLTGRPPFRSDSASATLHQIANDEPAPPRRLNPRIPRDLETICLKCLQREPQRRYGTAQELADDVRRFDRGEPIKARPAGLLERTLRWVRRRPALAGALAAGVLLGAGLVVTLVWWQAQRAALEATAVAYAEADLQESERLRDRGEFKTSAAVLERARDRLNQYVPPDLRDRLLHAVDQLELVTRLDSIRLERALVEPQALVDWTSALSVLPPLASHTSGDGDGASAEDVSGRHYEEAFGEAGIGAPGDEPTEAAARIRGSPLRAALVAALDDWAACATDAEQQGWVLAVLQHADPDPWRNLVRNPATWDDPTALKELADHAPIDAVSPQLLAVLGARLRARQLDAVGFLERVTSAYPGDFWVNVEMGNALCSQSNWTEAVGYYRTALAMRPDTVTLRYILGDLYLAHQRWDGAVAEYEQAGRLDPDNAWRHNRLGFTLAWKGGRDDEAIAHFREALRIDPDNGWSHYFLGIALDIQGNWDDAIVEFEQAARLLPEKRADAMQHLRKLLLRLGRGAEACAAWREQLAELPEQHEDWFGYAELCLFLGDEAEYRRARSALLAQFGSATDPATAERTGRACLLLPAAEGELAQAVALTERAVAAGRPGHEFAYPYRLFAQGLARYRQGRDDEAIELMSAEAASAMGPCPRLIIAMALYRMNQQEDARRTLTAAIDSYDWSISKADNHDAWIAHILRRETEILILSEQPASPETGD